MHPQICTKYFDDQKCQHKKSTNFHWPKIMIYPSDKIQIVPHFIQSTLTCSCLGEGNSININISLVYKKPFHFSIGTRCFETSHNLLKHSEKFPSAFGYNLIFVNISLWHLEGVKVPPCSYHHLMVYPCLSFIIMNL